MTIWHKIFTYVSQLLVSLYSSVFHTGVFPISSIQRPRHGSHESWLINEHLSRAGDVTLDKTTLDEYDETTEKMSEATQLTAPGEAMSPNVAQDFSQEPLPIELDDSELLGEVQIEAGGERIPLSAALESLLFVSGTPVEIKQLARALHLEREIIVAGLKRLDEHYQQRRRGLRVQERAGSYQLVTMPAVASVVEEFLNLDLSSKLSGPALETLSVIAYRQPVTRAQIEAVRGVDCSGVLRSLIQRGLVEESGRLEVAGRPLLYSITELFMQHFGLPNLGELPPLAGNEEALLQLKTQLAELGETSTPADS